MLDIVILAAGKGTRMRSNKPKVLHPIAGKPFVSHVIDRSREINADNINVIVGFGAEQVYEELDGQGLNFVEQKEQLGTGHAVQQALPFIREDASVLILYGDVPLIESDTLRQLLSVVSETSMGLLTVTLANPLGYGRIVRNRIGSIEAIVEQKDASKEQLEINEINTGVMALKGKHLIKWLPQLSNNNAQGEYYLTDIIEMAVADGIEVRAAHPHHEAEVMGVNNRKQQADLERIYQARIAEKMMADGVSIIDPRRFDLRGSLTTGHDCLIDINCVFEGVVILGNNVTVGPNCVIRDSVIASNTIIKANSIIEGSKVSDGCVVGPFARLRPGTELLENVNVGNFVETKNSTIGKNTKANHLSYIGDSKVGEGVNFGAGCITCNYDGAEKHQTNIGDDVFIGSNSALVAPLTIAKGATIGAGSVITKTVEEGQLAINRARQENHDNWDRPRKK